MSRVIYFIVAYGFWLLLTLSLEWDRLVAGAVVCLLTTMIFARNPIVEKHKLLQPKRYFWMIYYVFLLLWECLKANLDVAYRVLHPAMPIHPGIVKVRTSLKSDLGRTSLANSITMTPGTLSVDVTDDGYIYIHWINVKTQNLEQATEKIVAVFEKVLKRIFE